MHAGISLRTYPRSDTKLSRPHPDTTLTVAPDSGTRTISEFQIHFFFLNLTYSKLILYNFQNPSLRLSEKTQIPKMSSYYNFSTGSFNSYKIHSGKLILAEALLKYLKDIYFILRERIKVLSYFENPFQHTYYFTIYMQSISLTIFHTISENSPNSISGFLIKTQALKVKQSLKGKPD